jgi:YHS domain-containing protein
MSTPSAINPTPVTINNQMADIKGEPGKPQTVDVLTGDAVDRNLYGDYDGKRVFFCHPGSKTRFESNAAENLQKTKEKGIVLEKVPVG